MANIHFTSLCILVLSTLKFGVDTMQDFPDPYATIYLYSGLPNPQWKLSIEEWHDLNQLIQELPKLSDDNIGPYQFNADLGYSGFYAHFIIISSYPDVYYVAKRHQVVISNPGGHIIMNDEHKVIENWFMESAKRHGIPIPITV